MPELKGVGFGANVTTLQAPQGAGATPIAGVKPAIEDKTFAPGLIGIAETLALGATKFIQDSEKSGSGFLADYNNKMFSISSALKSGGITLAQADAQAKALSAQTIARAAGNLDTIKAVNESAKAFLGITNLGQAASETDDATKFAKELDRDIIKRLSENGVPVVANPNEKTMQAYRDLANSINYSDQKFKRDRENFEYGKSRGQYTVEQQKEQNKQEVNTFIATNHQATMDTLDNMTLQLKSAIIHNEIPPEEAQQQLAASSQFFQDQLFKLSPGNPDLTASALAYIRQRETTLQKILDPKSSLETAENQLKLMQTRDKLWLNMNNPEIRAFTAIESISRNNPFLQNKMTPTLLQAMTPLVLSFDPNKRSDKAGGNINYKDSGTKRDFFSSVQEGIKTVQAEMNRPDGDKTTGPESMNNMVNNILAQAGELSSDRQIKATDAQAVVNFLATEEFRQWKEGNTLNSQALKGAQDMLSNVYFRGVQRTIVDQLERPVPQAGTSGSFITMAAIGAVTGQPSGRAAPLQYKDLFTVSFDGSGINFTPRKIEGMDMLQVQESQQFISELDKVKKVINTSIRAGANVLGQKDLNAYWESHKQLILPYYFGGEGTKIEVGDVVNGRKYLGGALKSRFSWEVVDAGDE